MKKTLMVVDGNSLMYRAFYALPLLTNKEGQYTNAVYGFFSMLINALASVKPDCLAIAFDMKGKTFRHEMYTEYKAGRRETPDELIPQFDLLKDALRGMGIAVLESEGYEADDILGMLSKLAEARDADSVLLTGDRDALQLISSHCRVMLTRKGVSELALFDREKLSEEYGLEPAQIIDLKGFMGDASDHIPGVPGVGEKTALKLLHEYRDMDGVYAQIDNIAGKLKEKLSVNRELAYLSRTLATIDTNVPIGVTLDDLTFGGMTAEAAKPVFARFGFGSLQKRLEGGDEGIPVPEVPATEAVRISDIPALREALKQAAHAELVALDLEGEISFAFAGEKEYILQVEHSLLNVDFTREMVLDEMAAVLSDVRIPKLLHDAKPAIAMLREAGIEPKGIVFDTKLAEYALDPGTSDYSLRTLGEKYGVSGSAAAIQKLYPLQKKLLEDNGLWIVYSRIEAPLTQVLLDMERTGFRIDREALHASESEMTRQLDALTQDIYTLSGYNDFNINSTKQLGQLLFERLSLPVVKKMKTGYSTDIEVLEKLSGKHPVIDKIIEYRKLSKLKSTYIDGLAKIADKDGFVHTTFVQISTVTGRISSKEPNLQNIPVRTQEGREIRRLFLPSSSERKLVAADYSQIELRILASIAGDTVMQEAFREGLDIHTRTASEVFGVSLDAVTSDMRRSAKAVNFGIVYGISDFGLARNLDIPVKRAAEYIRRYFERFPGVRAYMDGIIEKAKADGYVTTLLGRRRYLPELKSNNYNIRSFGERAALNTPIQGTAADIIKLAMIDVHSKLLDGGYQSRLILQVHDELIIDAAPEEAGAVGALLKECMENAYPLDVPVVAQLSVGDNWLDAK